MFGLPAALLMLIALIALIGVLFLVFKRPMYENMACGLLLLVALSGQWEHLGEYLVMPAQDSLFYVIFTFMVLAVLFDATDVVGRIVQIMLALIGRFRGGSGYVATLTSAFMASLSGSGPGNAAAVGAFTIPMMKRAGFKPHTAASIEMSASMLGNIIPPAGIIFLTYGVVDRLYPGEISLSGWTLASYTVGLWFLLQKIVVLFAICRVTKVEPIPVAERPRLREAWRDGWPALLLPVLMFVPLLIDFLGEDMLIARLGEEGADNFSSAVLMFTPGIAAAYALLIGRRSLPGGKLRLAPVLEIFRGSLPKVVPVAATVYFAYAISDAFVGLDADAEIQEWVTGLDLNIAALVVLLPLVFAVLGMVLPGTAQVAILGGSLVAAWAALGGDPLLLAVMLPALTGALEGMTPPLALGLFVTMGIAGSEFGKTARAATVWIVVHLLMSMALLAGLLPIAGI
ncbi:TRAP transporter large permease subunit [Actinomadura sp. WMMB 499]|uniref:TRAP transporter large permease subunit n=1 Tax=Actinomadura sp. WMMB 499 TaxID=1219491 RepID=UPI0012468E5D|nr:TRAP transporter large permease subunit [Actinomadura sp. WMMB 499]QFG22281.1 TRAP transporter large permease subunit [Actinomadura sp. WMMB 499]